jgi:hypothetical protein
MQQNTMDTEPGGRTLETDTLSRLAAIDFGRDIDRWTQDFVGREWVFKEIDAWLKRGHERFFILTGEPGVGKSAIAARLTRIRKDIAAYHFCISGRSRTVVPGTALRSLAAQLGDHLPGYGRALANTVKPIHVSVQVDIDVKTMTGGQITGVVINHLHAGDPEEELDILLRAPLAELPTRPAPILILVDSLDEAVTHRGEVNLVTLLAEVDDLPSWVRFVCTSRPERRVLRYFEGLAPHFLGAESQMNLDDLQRYIDYRAGTQVLRGWLHEADVEPEHLADRVAELANGNFLFARILLDDVEAGLQPVDDLEALPTSLDGVYHGFLTRFTVSEWEDCYQPILGVLAVAREPVTEDQVASFTGIRRTKLRQRLGVARQFLDQWQDEQGAVTYALFHHSLRDYLLDKARNEDFWCAAEDWHQAIAGSLLSLYRERWQDCEDEYALRYTPSHLVEALREAGESDRRRDLAVRLHGLVQDEGFGQAKLDQYHAPDLLLEDLRLALTVALADEDLDWVRWHTHRYRDVVRSERTTQRVFAECSRKEYRAALSRTILFGDMPNSQAIMRLWIAWTAATQGDVRVATTAAELALERLPPRGIVTPKMKQVDVNAAHTLGDAVATTISWLLVRTAWQTAKLGRGPGPWLDQVASSWPAVTREGLKWALAESSEEWASTIGPPDAGVSMDLLLNQLEEKMIGSHPTTYREASMLYKDSLARGIVSTRHLPPDWWLDYVLRSVTLIAMDDYPSYREMALAWLAAASLTHEDDSVAQQALHIILEGALEKPEPAFVEDLPAAVLHALAQEKRATFTESELRDVMRLLPGDESVPDPPQVGGGWGTVQRSDPWAHGIRRASAMAAVLHRQGQRAAAQDVLERAGSRWFELSYAGYRALARLSLACRWLEWGKVDKARQQLIAAHEDADAMIDKVLCRARSALVEEMESWLKCFEQEQESWADVEACLSRSRTLSEANRSYYVQFLSAIWARDAHRLKRLVPLSLDDPVAMDAVMGRLVGALVLRGFKGERLRRLATAMYLEGIAIQYIGDTD